MNRSEIRVTDASTIYVLIFDSKSAAKIENFRVDGNFDRTLPSIPRESGKIVEKVRHDTFFPRKKKRRPHAQKAIAETQAAVFIGSLYALLFREYEPAALPHDTRVLVYEARWRYAYANGVMLMNVRGATLPQRPF